MSVVRINGYFMNITKCIGKEWMGKLQLQRIHNKFLVSNGFGGLGMLDANTQSLLHLYGPISKGVHITIGQFNGNGYNVEIKIFFA
jgi:hypothetical protein